MVSGWCLWCYYVLLGGRDCIIYIYILLWIYVIYNIYIYVIYIIYIIYIYIYIWCYYVLLCVTMCYHIYTYIYIYVCIPSVPIKRLTCLSQVVSRPSGWCCCHASFAPLASTETWRLMARSNWTCLIPFGGKK